MKVYIVEGQTGEYDDHCHWIASVCGSKRTAEARCRKLNAATGKDRGRNTYRAGGDARKAWAERMKEAGDLSPHLDYTGTTYEVADSYEVVTRA